MLGPKKTEVTKLHEADLKILRDMQGACLDGKVTETEYNNFKEKETIRLIALGVQGGMIPAFVKDGNPSLTR